MRRCMLQGVIILALSVVLAGCSGEVSSTQVEDPCIQHRAKALEIKNTEIPNKDLESLKLAHFVLTQPQCWDDEMLATARARITMATPGH